VTRAKQFPPFYTSEDAEIRKQIRECSLFMPVISANTQARAEGYFRREWKLAVERTHDMADHVTFLVPVVLDDTRDREAHVPEAFLKVQWTRLPGGETPPAFAERVRKLLGGDPTLQPRWWTDANSLLVLREAGFGQEAEEAARRLPEMLDEKNGTRASILASLGRTDEAIAQLAKVRPGASALGSTFYTEIWAEARQRPAFVEALRQHGCLEEFQTAQATLARMQAPGKK
jgi:hypothetical protein